jgi:hypothetical protein
MLKTHKKYDKSQGQNINNMKNEFKGQGLRFTLMKMKQHQNHFFLFL